MRLQADPDRYIDLVAFVRNPDKFKEKVANTKKDEVVKKTWNFIKGNASLQRNTGSQQAKTSNKTDDFKIDYKRDFKL